MIMLKMLSKRDKKIYYIIVIIIIFGLIYNVGYKILWTNKAKMKAQIKEEIIKISDLKDSEIYKINNTKEIEIAQEKLIETKKKLNVDITNGSTWYEIGQYLENSNLKLISLKPQPLQEENLFFVLPLKMSLMGEYEEIIGFFNFIENLSSICSISSFRLSSSRENNSSELNAMVDLKFYGSKTQIKEVNYQSIINIQKQIFKNPKPIDDVKEISVSEDTEVESTNYYKEKYSFPTKTGGK